MNSLVNKVQTLSFDELNKAYAVVADVYNEKVKEGKHEDINMNNLRQTLLILRKERHRQINRRCSLERYYRIKAAENLEMIKKGMYVRFRYKGEVLLGQVQKVCAKTFIINVDKVQWQISARFVNACRRQIHNRIA